MFVHVLNFDMFHIHSLRANLDWTKRNECMYVCMYISNYTFYSIVESITPYENVEYFLISFQFRNITTACAHTWINAIHTHTSNPPIHTHTHTHTSRNVHLMKTRCSLYPLYPPCCKPTYCVPVHFLEWVSSSVCLQTTILDWSLKHEINQSAQTITHKNMYNFSRVVWSVLIFFTPGRPCNNRMCRMDRDGPDGYSNARL